MWDRSIKLLEQSPSLLMINVKGSSLILSLWVLFLLTIFVVTVGSTVRQKVTLVQRIEEKNKLRLIAEAGVKRAIAEFKKEDLTNYDTLTDAWSNNSRLFQKISVSDGYFNICYDYLDEKTEHWETRYGLIDEERKININQADISVLERFFRIVLGWDEMEAQDLAASIVDWRDSDSALSIPLGSAEDSYYRNLFYSYESKDAQFEVLDEILLVKGMTQDIFEKIKDYITRYGDGRVNINTASKIVLLALGLNEDTVYKILSFRKGEDGLEATSDDNVFDNPSNIVVSLGQFYSLTSSEKTTLAVLADQKLGTTSNYFTIRSLAQLEYGKNVMQVHCVVNREGKIFYWQEI